MTNQQDVVKDIAMRKGLSEIWEEGYEFKKMHKRTLL